MDGAKWSVIVLSGALALAAACSGRSTDPSCGGVCGGNGPVTLQVVNPTSSYIVHFGWWWQSQTTQVDSVLPNDSVCVLFNAQVWAQVSAAYGPQIATDTGGAYLSLPFDPVQVPHWRLVAKPAPRPPSGVYGFAVTNPANGC